MVTILLVEDDDGHAHLVQRNLERAGLTNPVVRARDGEEALQIVSEFQQKLAEGEPLKLLVVLDINMPKLNGFEVLKALKSNPETAPVPVIILTTTDDQREIERGYELGCNVYITKPVEYEAFLEATRRLGLFIQIIQIPPGSRAK